MNIWLILWCVLAGGLVAFFVWTLLILTRQKAAWKVYAQKRKLRYKPGKLMESPEMEGVIGDHSVSLFSREYLSPDVRGVRKLTAIEVNLNSVMPIAGGVASGGMVEVINDQNLKQKYAPDHEGWDKSYIAASSNRDVLAAYLNADRLDALIGLMAVEHAWMILIFKGDAMLLRLDTPVPLDSPNKVDALVKQMLAAAGVLELKKGEVAFLESEEIKAVTKNIALEVDEEALAEKTAFELEEDGGEEG